MSAVTLVLTFDRDRWHACGGDVALAHRELRGLEQLIEKQLAPAAPVVVHLEFDMACVPRWLHQYHGHYCNYTLHVAPHGARA